MRRKNGFTLIELLAVIVILAIIALISTPIVIGIIEKARMGALEDSAYGIVDAARAYFLSDLAEQNEFMGKQYDFSKNVSELPISGKVPTKGTLTISDEGSVSLFFEEDGYCVVKEEGMEKASSYKGNCEKKNFDFIAKPQEYNAPSSGKYLIQLWGAEGGRGTDPNEMPVSGKGAYTRGILELKKGEKLYFYVGENPVFTSGECYDTNPNASFNGTLQGTCAGGGGATDVRLVQSDDWSYFDSLKSRIMVAAGGGGAHYLGSGGSGGALNGLNGKGYNPVYPNYIEGKGAPQINGFKLGIAGLSTTSGGGGYYGGYQGYAANAGGGSSFISGYKGCDAIKESSIEDNVTHTGNPNHYSGKVFTDSVMIDGDSEMPSPDGLTVTKGRIGNGYAKIIKIS